MTVTAQSTEDKGLSSKENPFLKPLTSSYSHHTNVPECCISKKVILGVDEAGRRPVLGNCYSI